MVSELLIIIFIASPLFALLIYLLKVNNKVKLDSNRYMFFKVRDDLIMLVAEGYLKENEFLFQTYYGMTNRIINNTHHFTFKSIVQSLTKIDEIMEKDSDFDRMEKELKEKDQEVKKVILGFYETFLIVLYRNSFIIRFTAKCIFPFVATIVLLNRIANVISNNFHNRYIEGTKIAWRSRNNMNHIMTLSPSS
ncbi:MAG: hypothetical protein MAG551_01974 [Candidatus Scalindua arabica]|uniref:Uncharacterized protein n=1 Tax=Candidatus Scalindua arabica TaxID=1127984 RepID=A0A941W6C6_9BACT|nr:hypothetical protein [Candidatus Scalindua arabica]